MRRTYVIGLLVVASVVGYAFCSKPPEHVHAQAGGFVEARVYGPYSRIEDALERIARLQERIAAAEEKEARAAERTAAATEQMARRR